MAKTTSDSILGVIQKESWILDQWNFRCHWQIEYGAATWRI